MTELTCYKHPDRPTLLRCNQCERPICTACATHTPTGYRCQECVRNQQKKFETAFWYDYLIVLASGALLSALASYLIYLISSFIWGLIVFFIAPFAGITIADLTRGIVKGRRSRWLNLTFGLSLVLGTLPMMSLLGLGTLWAFLLMGTDAFRNIFYGFGSPLFWQIIYLVLAVPTAYSRFAGIFLRR